MSDEQKAIAVLEYIAKTMPDRAWVLESQAHFDSALELVKTL